MQGTTGTSKADFGIDRFIPAYAGNGATDRASAIIEAVHPRVCRERRNTGRPDNARNGSSPRMQGTGVFPGEVRVESRFIPAYAGNGSRCRNRIPAMTVHPRVCRERQGDFLPEEDPPGSSPRMQGTDCKRDHRPDNNQFIPAYAGNGAVIQAQRALQSVHPRVCRERQTVAQYG